MTRRRAFEFARAPADETPLDWRTIAVVQMFSMLSIAGTTALFSTAYFAARALRPEASEASRALVAGALTATKPLASGASSLAWGRLGDARGFERAICASGVAHAIATAAFAMARTTSGAFAARACQGLADGMVVMQKPALALVSDETNVARAFATTGVAYGVASALAPALAAALSEPCENWKAFEGERGARCPTFLRRRPFFLSNIWIAALAAPTLMAYARGWMQIDKHRNRDDVEVVVELELLPDASEDDAAAETTAMDADVAAATKKAVESIEDEVVWWRDVNVRAAIASQVGCTAVVLCGAEMTPLWMATSVANGGLGWTSLEIGAFGTVMGCVILLFQVFLFTRLCRAYGIVTLLTYALLVNAVAFPLHPIAHVAAKKSKAWTWVAVVCLGLARGMSGPIIMGGSSLILNNASPRDTLGAVNGFSGTFGNAARGVAPLIGGSLVAMMVAMKPGTPGRDVWPFVVIGLGFVSLTVLSRRLSLDLNKPRRPRRTSSRSDFSAQP